MLNLSSILDDMVAQAPRVAMSGRTPQIVSEQHDVNQIDYGGDAAIDRASARRPQGPWDEREYGISLAEAQRRWDAAQTPEARAQVAEELRQRAISRAQLDTSNGRVNVMVAGKPAWHRLGVNVAQAVDAAAARRLAGIDWTASKRQAYFLGVDGQPIEADGCFHVVRDDTQEFLGAVGSRYAVIQNSDATDFLDAVIGEFGARYETAGAVFGGKKIWFQVQMPNQAFEVVPGDEVHAYATFFNTHDGSGSAYCYPTSNRVVCNNTLRVANYGKHKGISLRHTGDIKTRVADAQQALGFAVAGFEQFKESASVLAHTPVHAEAYFSDVLDAVLEITAADMLAGKDALAAALKVTTAEATLRDKTIEKAVAARKTLLDDMVERYNSERCGIGGIRGTAWAALNAVTEHADHYQAGRKVGTEHERDSRLFESILAGDRDELKQVAYERAVALAK